MHTGTALLNLKFSAAGHGKGEPDASGWLLLPQNSAVPFDSQDTFMQQSPHIPAAAAGAPKERVHWLKDLAKKLLWA